MAGQRGLDRDLRSLDIADLADEDDVRVLTQDGAQPARKGETDARIDLDLADPRQLDFDGVFDGDDVPVDRVDPRERAVERRGLAAPRRARHEHDSVGARDQLFPHRELAHVEAEALEIEHLRRAWKQAHHHPLAVADGHRGKAHVVVAPRDLEPDAAVLGQALLRDIELRP